MKQTHRLTVSLFLAVVLIACNGIVQTVEVTRVVPQTAVVTEAIQATAVSAPEGGFTTGAPVDVKTLPALMEVPGGGESTPCFTEVAEPSISWGYGVSPREELCLNNFPTAPDSPGFTVSLTDPTGRAFQESFTYAQGKILNSRGKEAGYIQKADSEGIDPATPGVVIGVYLPASFPCGNWTVSANTADGKINAGPTSLPIGCSDPLVSALPDLATNPFLSPEYGWSGPTVTTNETIYVVGTAYPPNTVLTVALYQDDPSAGKSELGGGLGAAKYAVTLTTDNSGSFQAPFIVGSATLRGPYYVIVAPTIQPDNRLDPFDAQFSIKS